MKRLTIGTALLVETLSPKNKVKCIVPQKRYFPTLTKALLEEPYLPHRVVGAIDQNPADGVILLDEKK